MWIYFSNSSKQICIFQCHLDHLFEASQRVHQSCRDSTKDNVKEFKDAKLLKSGHKPGPLHDLAFFILFLLYWAWNADTATVRESETEVMKDQLHFMYAQKIPKTQKPTQDTKFRAIHFICLGTRPPKKEGNTFQKEMKALWSKPHNVPRVVWVLWLFKYLRKKTGCDFKSTIFISKETRKGGTFKNCGCSHWNCLLLFPLTHSYATSCSYNWKQCLSM